VIKQSQATSSGTSRLFDPARHHNISPALMAEGWNEDQARALILRIVADSQARFDVKRFWPVHPLDEETRQKLPVSSLYMGAAGVVWALYALQNSGAVTLEQDYRPHLDSILQINRAWLGLNSKRRNAAYLMGGTPILMMKYARSREPTLANQLATTISENIDHPARELMWGAPGTMLAALFLYRATLEQRWAELFRESAAKLWSQLKFSREYQCHYWLQQLYGKTFTFLDGIHGFVATASPLIQGRDLLAASDWAAWAETISTTVLRNATWLESAGGASQANWRNQLIYPPDVTPSFLMQFCHGAPGFVVCLGAFPGTTLDNVLLAAGEAIWQAGPLAKGSNLCHGTGGNGYAFLKLYERTQDIKWLNRARMFAMHGILQTLADEARYDQMRYSLWTGDLGFAIYLWDCIRAQAAFPTLDVFYS
jgi:Lanthionine synthetase C-like protein